MTITAVEQISIATGNAALPILVANPFPQTNLLGDYHLLIASGYDVMNGQAISLANQSAGALGSLIAGGGANAPTFNAAGLAGTPTLTFDGTADFMVTPALGSPVASPYTIYLLAKPITWTANHILLDGGTAGAAHQASLFQAGSTPGIRMGQGGTTDTEAVSATLATWNVITGVFNGASSKLRLNTDAELTPTLTGVALAGLRLGNGANGGASHANFEFARALVYSGAHSTGTQDGIIASLRSLYGL